MGAGHDHASPGTPAPRLAIATALLGGFFVVELTTALTIGSISLLADAGHILTDVAATFMGLCAVILAQRGSTSPARTYGWHRAEVFTAVANAVLLIGVATLILREAIGRIGQAPDVPGIPMVVVALTGLATNAAVALLLRSQSTQSLAVKGAYMEVIADTVGSIGVLIAGLVTITTHWPYADVVVAVLVALWVLPRALSLAAGALRILSESSPSHINVDDLRAALAAVDGVTEVHDLHVWTLVPGKDMVTAHLTSCEDSARVLNDARAILADARPRARHHPDRAAGRLLSGPLAARRESRLLTQAEARAGARVAIVEQIQTPRLLIGLADGIGRPCQRRHAAQETAIRLMRIRHRAKAFPAVAAQLVQPAVIPRPRVGVGGDRLVVGEGVFGQRRPGDRGRRVGCGDGGRVVTGVQLGLGIRVTGQQGRFGSQQIMHRRHGAIVPCDHDAATPDLASGR